MNAIVLPEWGEELSVESRDPPTPGPGEVRVEVRACGVTRTVENAIQGGLDDDPGLVPRIPGHEIAGRSGAANQCANFGGWLGVNADGAYAEYATLPAANALPIPDDLPFSAAAIAADGLATPLHICERTGVDDDDTTGPNSPPRAADTSSPPTSTTTGWHTSTASPDRP